MQEGAHQHPEGSKGENLLLENHSISGKDRMRPIFN